MRIFEPALMDMQSSGDDTYGPMPFRTYLATHNLESVRAEQYLSIDSLQKLAPELKSADTMVFRLGSRPGVIGTHFGLSRHEGSWGSFFLDDRELLKGVEIRDFAPRVPSRRLIAFQLLPKLTETSLVNLAVASGLLQEALKISDDHEQVIPATSQSTYTFDFFPHLPMDIPWQHFQGQVEIDALFYGHRNGRETLFLVEAKSGLPNGTLAKHKLCYPLAALRPSVPEEVDIVPVYLKTWMDSDGRHFLVVECTIDSSSQMVISQFRPVKASHLVLREFG